MKRRDFLKIGSAATGAALVGGAIPAAGAEKAKLSTDNIAVEGYVKEPARKIPVIASCDILVAGAGPAGFAAALAAAREGASVILLEMNSFLGGLWTGGSVLPLNCMEAKTASGWKQVVYGIADELAVELKDMGMSIQPGRSPVVDPEATKHAMRLMVNAAGVKVLYFAHAVNIIKSGDRIDSVIIESKSGRSAIKAKYYVDTTGDGDLFYWAGESYRFVKHHIGAMWRVGNLKEENAHGSMTPIKGVGLMHTNGEYDQDGLDIFNMSRLNDSLRQYMWDKTQELRTKEGCEEAFLMETPPLLGVRVTRVLDSLRNVSMADAIGQTTYEDVVGIAGVDIDCDLDGNKYSVWDRPAWQIPLRSLLPRKTPNLVVAGRCFGYEADITYDAREIATCLVTGQAAGAAAARALLDRSAVQNTEPARVQAILKAQGVRI
ncbi:MAG: FAD-dependent oxidoreductase [Bacteroidales bacterium]|nr:FAD-dependent oxidoreductase [Bacteroidales bacterium]